MNTVGVRITTSPLFPATALLLRPLHRQRARRERAARVEKGDAVLQQLRLPAVRLAVEPQFHDDPFVTARADKLEQWLARLRLEHTSCSSRGSARWSSHFPRRL